MKKLFLFSISILISLASLAQGSIISVKQLRFFQITTAGDTAATVANDGRMWYDFTTDQYRGIRNGTSFSFGSGSGGGGAFWPLAGNATTTGNVGIDFTGRSLVFTGGSFDFIGDGVSSYSIGDGVNNPANISLESDNLLQLTSSNNVTVTGGIGGTLITSSGGTTIGSASSTIIQSNGTSSRITMGDDINILATFGNITSQTKHFFTPTATLAGLNIGSLSNAVPSSAINGDAWLDTNNQGLGNDDFRGFKNDEAVDFLTTGTTHLGRNTTIEGENFFGLEFGTGSSNKLGFYNVNTDNSIGYSLASSNSANTLTTQLSGGQGTFSEVVNNQSSNYTTQFIQGDNGADVVEGFSFRTGAFGTPSLRMAIRETGDIELKGITQDDTKTRMAAFDDVTGKIHWRAASTLGTIGGTIAATEVGYGSGANTLTSEPAFTYAAGSNTLTVDGTTLSGSGLLVGGTIRVGNGGISSNDATNLTVGNNGTGNTSILPGSAAQQIFIGAEFTTIGNVTIANNGSGTGDIRIVPGDALFIDAPRVVFQTIPATVNTNTQFLTLGPGNSTIEIKDDLNLPVSGTYTPTLFNDIQISSSTPTLCYYTRIGDIVTVTGRVNFTTTASTGATHLGISLPIASAFTALNDVNGVANSGDSDLNVGVIEADTPNDRGTLKFDNGTGVTGAGIYMFTFTYLVI